MSRNIMLKVILRMIGQAVLSFRLLSNSPCTLSMITVPSISIAQLGSAAAVADIPTPQTLNPTN